MSLINIVLILLQCYFLLMNVTVENTYCLTDFTDTSAFLVQETIDFCVENNRYFLTRPEWLVMATCVSSYGLAVGYLFTLWVALRNHWHKSYVVVPCLLFVGAKMYAIGFYHLMEFTSDTPPTNLVPYFAAEGPYVVSMLLIVYKIAQSLGQPDAAAAEQQAKKRE